MAQRGLAYLHFLALLVRLCHLELCLLANLIVFFFEFLSCRFMLSFHNHYFLAEGILDSVLFLSPVVGGLAVGISFTLQNLELSRQLLVRLLQRLDADQAILCGLFALVLDPLRQLLVVGLEVRNALLPVFVGLLFFDVSDPLQVFLLFFQSALVVDLFALEASFLVHQEPDLVLKQGPIFFNLAVQALILFLKLLQLSFGGPGFVFFNTQLAHGLLLHQRYLGSLLV